MSSVKLIDVSSKFDTQPLILYLNGKSIKSRGKDGNEIIFRSPLLEVVRPPSERKGRTNEYSVCVKLHSNNKPDTIKRFKELIDNTTTNAIKFMLTNSAQITGNMFNDENDFKVGNFWYNDTNFYMTFNKNVSSHVFNETESRQQSKKIFNTIKDDVCDYLGVGSLISVDLKHSIFFYNKSNTLYPFSLNIAKVVVWRKSNATATVTKSLSRHGKLVEPAFTVPSGYELSNLKIQKEVPIHNINDFNISNFNLSKVCETERGNVIYARYGGSSGPVYMEAFNVVVKYDIKQDPNYGSRTISIVDSAENRAIFTAIKEQYSKLLDRVTEESEKIFGEKYDRETVEGLISNPLYSQTDTEKKNARLSLKLPKEEKDKPYFRLFSMNADNTITEVDMGETCVEAEKYISAGTVLESIIFLVRPVIVNSQVYLSCRVEQILVNPNQDKVFIPQLNGFAFPSYETAKVDNRSSSVAIQLTNDNFSFGDYDKTKKTFYLNVENNGITTNLVVLPTPITVRYQVDIKDDPENNKYAFRIRYDHTDTKFLELTRAIDNSVIKYCMENSKEIFGSKKTEKIITASVNKGKLEKYAKKDTDRKNPYGTIKLPVYENYGKECIGFEVYKSISSLDGKGLIEIQKVELNSTNDLLGIFDSGATLLPIVKLKGSRVDMRISLTAIGCQFLIVNQDETENVPFVENFDLSGIDFTSISSNMSTNDVKESSNTTSNTTLNVTSNITETTIVEETPEPTVNTKNNNEEEGSDSSSESEDESD
jgi:hypothetical protein